MILPFVRELLADAEKSTSFLRAVARLKGQEGEKSDAGRISLSGLTSSAKALHLALLRRALGRPLLVLTADNRAAEELLPVVQAFAELSGAALPDGVLLLPALDVVPYENLSPHPDVQERRAIVLARMAAGSAEIVIAPIAAVAVRLRQAEFYTGLTRTLRKGETIEIETLVEQLNSVGYTRADVVEMPGEYALRGGILDVYPPEADRPLRVEFFGDEAESIRKFDPATQRSQTPVDEAELLPLTETPLDERTLAAIHARLSGQRLSGTEEIIERTLSEGGVSVFPGWELYAPLAYAQHTNTLALTANAAVFVDEPAAVNAELDRWWERVEEAHARSGVGALAPPQELFIAPDDVRAQIVAHPGAELEQLAIAASDRETIEFLSQPTARFHGSVAAMAEEIAKLTAEGKRVLFCAANTGELERLAEIFSEYNVPFRLGTRAPRPGDSYVD